MKGTLVIYKGRIWVVVSDKKPYKLRYPIPEELESDKTLEDYIKGIKRR